MKVLVIGSGARENAIVHALRRSRRVEEVFAAPGNPGIAQAADLLPIGVDDLPALAEAASDLKVDLTVVGPEIPLALGIADEFSNRGLNLFGPSRLAAELEASKVFAKEFCRRNDIATAEAVCVRTRDEAVQAARNMGLPVVFKADGLAAGKGVQIVCDEDGLEQAIDTYFVQRRFGEAGDQVLVEECVTGEELSFMVISDGTRIVPLATSHDYKRLFDDDRGPNTGGMGAHSPARVQGVSSNRILEEVVQPTIAAMAAEGREYRGVLYVGLMLTAKGPLVLEFNCRLGDPETQAVLLRLDDDFAGLLRRAAAGRLKTNKVRWRRQATACVVLAAAGYPTSPRRGDEISGIDEALAIPGVTVYHAGTRLDNSKMVTAGGRVLSICGRGATLAEAVATAYQGVDKVNFAGQHCRSDIGADTLARMGGAGDNS